MDPHVHSHIPSGQGMNRNPTQHQVMQNMPSMSGLHNMQNMQSMHIPMHHVHGGPGSMRQQNMGIPGMMPAGMQSVEVLEPQDHNPPGLQDLHQPSSIPTGAPGSIEWATRYVSAAPALASPSLQWINVNYLQIEGVKYGIQRDERGEPSIWLVKLQRKEGELIIKSTKAWVADYRLHLIRLLEAIEHSRLVMGTPITTEGATLAALRRSTKQHNRHAGEIQAEELRKLFNENKNWARERLCAKWAADAEKAASDQASRKRRFATEFEKAVLSNVRALAKVDPDFVGELRLSNLLRSRSFAGQRFKLFTPQSTRKNFMEKLYPEMYTEHFIEMQRNSQAQQQNQGGQPGQPSQMGGMHGHHLDPLDEAEADPTDPQTDSTPNDAVFQSVDQLLERVKADMEGALAGGANTSVFLSFCSILKLEPSPVLAFVYVTCKLFFVPIFRTTFDYAHKSNASWVSGLHDTENDGSAKNSFSLGFFFLSNVPAALRIFLFTLGATDTDVKIAKDLDTMGSSEHLASEKQAGLVKRKLARAGFVSAMMCKMRYSSASRQRVGIAELVVGSALASKGKAKGQKVLRYLGVMPSKSWSNNQRDNLDATEFMDVE